MRWNKVCIEWRPAVGTTTNGIVTYGVRLMDDLTRVDGNPQLPASRATVSALYPVNDHPVWQGATLVVNKDLLMSRKWYATKSTSGVASNVDNLDLCPGTFLYGIDHDADVKANFYGEFWITYSVTLDGTRQL